MRRDGVVVIMAGSKLLEVSDCSFAFSLLEAWLSLVTASTDLGLGSVKFAFVVSGSIIVSGFGFLSFETASVFCQ